MNTAGEYQELKARAGRWVCGHLVTRQGRREPCHNIPASVRTVADGEMIPQETLPPSWVADVIEGEMCGKCAGRLRRGREELRNMIDQADSDQWDRWADGY